MMGTTSLRLAWRRLRKTPGSAALSMLALTVALTLLATLWTLVDSVLIRRSSAPNAARMVAASCLDQDGIPEPISPAVAAAVRASGRTASHYGAYVGGLAMLTTIGGYDEMTNVELVDPEYFDVMGIHPMLGRVFTRQDVPNPMGPAAVAFAGYGFWRDALGARPDAVGQTITVDGVALTIVGVADRSFTGLQQDLAPALVLPLSFRVGATRKVPVPGSDILALLSDGRSGSEMLAELTSMWPQLVQSTPTLSEDARQALSHCHLTVSSVSGGFSDLRTRYGASLKILMVGCGLLVALCAVHLALTFAARVSVAQSETATLRMLGCSDQGVIRHWLAEVALLVLPAAVMAIGMGPMVARVWVGIVWTSPHSPTVPLGMRLDTIALVMSAAMATALLMLAFPVGRFWTTRTRGLLASARGATRTNSATQVLVGVQIALSLILTAMAMSMSTGAFRLSHVTHGVQTGHIEFGRLLQRPGAYLTLDEHAYYPEVLRQVSALPGVEAASFSRIFPLPVAPKQTVQVPETGTMSEATVDVVSPDFARVLQISLRRGRFLQWSDSKGSTDVAVITQSLSQMLFSGADPIGRTLVVGSPAKTVSVVGVCDDFSVGDVHKPMTKIVLRPTLQEPAQARSPLLLVRTAPGIAPQSGAVRKLLAGLGKEHMPLSLPLTAQIARSFARETLTSQVAAAFAFTSMLLCGLAVFGFLSQVLAQRRREVAVRMALGASGRDAAFAIGRRLARSLLIGAALGGPGALLATRALEHQSEGLVVGAAGWGTLVAVIATAVLAAAAAAFPSMRAASTSPAMLLREE